MLKLPLIFRRGEGADISSLFLVVIHKKIIMENRIIIKLQSAKNYFLSINI